MSDTRRTVGVMEANTPPKSGTAEHWAAWLEAHSRVSENRRHRTTVSLPSDIEDLRHAV